MAEVNGELIYETLKKIHADISLLREGQRDMRNDGLSVRNQIHDMQGDINSLSGSTSQMGDRLERIGTRLELRELAELNQDRFDPNS
jgi:hypothetical protein